MIVSTLAKRIKSRLTVGHRSHFIAGLGQLIFLNPAKAFVVVDQQDLEMSGAH